MYAFVILKDDVTESDEDIIKELKALVRQKIAAYAVPDIIQVRTYWYGHKVAWHIPYWSGQALKSLPL